MILKKLNISAYYQTITTQRQPIFKKKKKKKKSTTFEGLDSHLHNFLKTPHSIVLTTKMSHSKHLVALLRHFTIRG